MSGPQLYDGPDCQACAGFGEIRPPDAGWGNPPVTCQECAGTGKGDACGVYRELITRLVTGDLEAEEIVRRVRTFRSDVLRALNTCHAKYGPGQKETPHA